VTKVYGNEEKAVVQEITLYIASYMLHITRALFLLFISPSALAG
jgi:hypothetical protein